MITFQALRDRMKKQGKSIYHLSRDKVVGGATLDKIRADAPGVTIASINAICNYLHCKPGDILSYTPDAPPPDHTEDE